MSRLHERIAQFRKMAHDDPENELGHFRLGQLLAEAGEHEEAVRSFQRALELSPQFSKVYQLLAASRIALGRRDEAIEALKQGFAVADERNDALPRDEMAKMLVHLGEPAPVSQRASAALEGFCCQRPGCPAGSRVRRLTEPPMNDELGQRIFASICADCWNEWLRNYSIKVINEMHLDLSTERGQGVYDQILCEFMGFV